MPTNLRVVVVTDHPVIGWGIRAALATDQRAIVTVTSTIAEIEQLCQAHIVMVDADIAGLRLSALITQLKHICTDVPIVLLSAATVRVAARTARMLGVAAYLLKTDSLSQIATTLHAVANRTTWSKRRPFAPRSAVSATLYESWGLSPRELAVLRALVHGLSNKQIAAQLHASLYTVRNCTGIIYDKLGVTSRTAAIVWALQHQIFDYIPER